MEKGNRAFELKNWIGRTGACLIGWSATIEFRKIEKRFNKWFWIKFKLRKGILWKIGNGNAGLELVDSERILGKGWIDKRFSLELAKIGILETIRRLDTRMGERWRIF